MVSLDLGSQPLSGHTCAVELSEGAPSLACRRHQAVVLTPQKGSGVRSGVR